MAQLVPFTGHIEPCIGQQLQLLLFRLGTAAMAAFLSVQGRHFPTLAVFRVVRPVLPGVNSLVNAECHRPGFNLATTSSIQNTAATRANC